MMEPLRLVYSAVVVIKIARPEDQRHIVTSSARPNELENFAKKSLEGNQLTPIFCLTGRPLSCILTQWSSDAVVSSFTVLSGLELTIPSVLFFRPPICEQVNIILQRMFSEPLGVSQQAH